jgi:RNA polymerase sigma-70 factor (ECF subfamily)
MKIRLKTLTRWTDLELVRAFQKSGKEVYFNQLFERYYPLVYTKCLSLTTQREESKDLTLVVFTKAYGLLPQQQLERFDHWLFTLTQRECLNYLRRKTNAAKVRRQWWEYQQRSEDTFMENEAFRRVYYEEELTKDQLYQEGLQQLPEAQRICLQLFTIELKSYQEIADYTHFPLNKVKSHLQNARRQLKIWVSEKMKAQNEK